MRQEIQAIFLAVMTGVFLALLFLFYYLIIKPNQEKKHIHQNKKDNEETSNILWDCEAQEFYEK